MVDRNPNEHEYRSVGRWAENGVEVLALLLFIAVVIGPAALIVWLLS